MKWKTVNDGKWLEKLLVVTHHAYAENKIAKIEKVESPTRVVRGQSGKLVVVQLANPFVDFIGATRGRAVCMEAKSTEVPRLKLLSDGGVTNRQWDALAEWEKHGAMCCVIWGYTGELRFCSMAMMKEELASGRRSVSWEAADKIAQGVGFILNDWLLNLRAAYNYPTVEPLVPAPANPRQETPLRPHHI